MSIPTIEGIVENGQIRLLEDIQLPDNTRVYVVVAESDSSRPAGVYSPRLAHPEQADDFKKQVFEEEEVTDA